MGFLSGVFGQPQQQPSQQQQPQGQGQQLPGSQQGAQFRPGQQQPNQQFQPTNGNGSGGPAGNQQQPANSQMQGAGNNSANPLDPFMDLMTPKPEVIQQRQTQQQQASKGLFGEVTPEQIQQQAKSMNFMQSADPAKVQAALGGDVGAFTEVINGVVQQAFATSVQMTRAMVEHGVNTGNERFSSTLDSRFRDFQLMNKNSENPALSHPVGKALLSTIKRQIASAQPSLGADEIHAKAEEMFNTFASQLTAKPQSQQEQAQNAGPNWEMFLDSAP